MAEMCPQNIKVVLSTEVDLQPKQEIINNIKAE